MPGNAWVWMGDYWHADYPKAPVDGLRSGCGAVLTSGGTANGR